MCFHSGIPDSVSLGVDRLWLSCNAQTRQIFRSYQPIRFNEIKTSLPWAKTGLSWLASAKLLSSDSMTGYQNVLMPDKLSGVQDRLSVPDSGHNVTPTDSGLRLLPISRK